MTVSIVIPVYNVAPYIEDCLRSVMRQTYAGAMECLIVDDCGTDESISIAERVIAEYEGPIRFEILLLTVTTSAVIPVSFRQAGASQGVIIA